MNTMKNTLTALILGFSLIGFTSNILAGQIEQAEKKLWNELYQNGGTTFYSKKEFTKKSPLISATRVYSASWIREALHCGTHRQCKKTSDQYNRIMSDLHNIVPADSYLTFKLQHSIFGDLDESAPIIRGELRKRDQIISPPADIKGDIARTILYMHTKYQLPLLMNFSLLAIWDKNDPPSQNEIAQNLKIAKIQGNENTFISQPNIINVVKR